MPEMAAGLPHWAFRSDPLPTVRVLQEAHIAKPVVPPILYATLHQLLPLASFLATAPVMAAPVADDDSARLARLQEIPGLDISDLFSMVEGELLMVFELLESFCLDHGNDGDKAWQLFSAGDMPTARRVAHTVKGVAATLGMAAIQHLAAKLEESLSGSIDQHAIAARTAPLQESLTAMVRALKPLLPTSIEPLAEESP